MDYWTRELINAYDNVIRNIYILEVDLDGHLVNFLEEIESQDTLKVYTAVWEVDDNGKIVYTKDGKVVLNKEPSATLLRIMGNQLNAPNFVMVQMGTSQSLAEVHKLGSENVFTKMNEDRSFYESRGSWKKVKGDLETEAPRKLADLSLTWDKMTGSTTGTI